MAGRQALECGCLPACDGQRYRPTGWIPDSDCRRRSGHSGCQCPVFFARHARSRRSLQSSFRVQSGPYGYCDRSAWAWILLTRRGSVRTAQSYHSSVVPVLQIVIVPAFRPSIAESIVTRSSARKRTAASDQSGTINAHACPESGGPVLLAGQLTWTRSPILPARK